MQPTGGPGALLEAAGRLVGELALAGRQVATQARSSGEALRRPSAVVVVLLALWVVGILGDAATTLLMMGTGRFEEANVAAASLMGVFGVTGWVLLSSLVCVAIASLTLSRPRGTYAWTAAAVGVLVCLGKVWTTVSNALLWWTTSG
ncbi:MAG: hypothetical protein ACO1ON_10400 [Nocardioides sp.]